jgi:hypothetical protein
MKGYALGGIGLLIRRNLSNRMRTHELQGLRIGTGKGADA